MSKHATIAPELHGTDLARDSSLGKIFSNDFYSQNNPGLLSKIINNYKSEITNLYHIKHILSEQQQEWLPKIVSMAAEFDLQFPRFGDSNTLSSLAHIIDPSNIKENIQNSVLIETIKHQNQLGLQWFLAIGFDPSSKDSNGFNVLESFANLTLVQSIPNSSNIAKMLIGAKKDTENLEKERVFLRKRTIGGKDITGLEGKLSDLVIFGLDKDLIKLSEFANKGEGQQFEDTVRIIFSNETRTNNLLQNYNSQSREKIIREDLSDILLIERKPSATDFNIEKPAPEKHTSRFSFPFKWPKINFKEQKYSPLMTDASLSTEIPTEDKADKSGIVRNFSDPDLPSPYAEPKEEESSRLLPKSREHRFSK